MPNPQPGRLSQADKRQIRKVATGPLLGRIAGKPAPAPTQSAPAKAAPLGHFGRVKATLDRVRDANASS
jgi:hypothetical protein